MERWEALVEDCPPAPDLRYFSKAIQTAEVVLKEDLAPFEIDWIFQTLLYNPVNVLSTVKEKSSEDVWSKPIGDAFKLLGQLAESQTEKLEAHFEEIVNICLLRCDSRTRGYSLACLSSIARVSPLGVRDAAKHIACLEEIATCKAPMAELIGTICEYHPEAIADEANKLWRVFLNLLDSKKNTDQISASQLKGVLGLLKHFGDSLPTRELNMFYDKMSSEYILTPKSEAVCLTILSNHASLFRERICEDNKLRCHLWYKLFDSSGQKTREIVRTIFNVYVVMTEVLNQEEIKKIAESELLSHTDSYKNQIKYTSLRILSYINNKYKIHIKVNGMIDVQSLEFELRDGKVGYDIAEAVAWCIEANLPNSDNLLQTAILFYTNLPAARRKEIVVHGILNAPSELRTATLTYLISESTSDSTDTHTKLWKDLFDSNKGKDSVVVEKSKLVFDDFMGYVVFVLEKFLEEDVEKPSEKLISLLHLTSRVLTLQPPEEFTKEYCTILLPIIMRLIKEHPHAAGMAVVRCALPHLGDELPDFGGFFKTLYTDCCKDEALLCESYLTMIEAPEGTVDVENVLTALQIIFSRNDVEPATLSKALKKLEDIINKGNIKFEENNALHEIIHTVARIRTRSELKGKDARVLRRDVLMFMGKYGDSSVKNNSKENLDLVKLMDSLTLNVPIPNEGINYKINLQRILHLALEREDHTSLQTLLVIICANLATKKDPQLQRVLVSVCISLSRSFARGFDILTRHIQAAISMCDTTDCVREIVHYISSEKSPGVRKMLSDALEGLLQTNRDDSLVGTFSELYSFMLRSHLGTIKRAGLDLTETLTSAIEKNNKLTKELLPDILISITQTFELHSDNAFEIATKHFMDRIELFSTEVVKKLLKDLLVLVTKPITKSIHYKDNNYNPMSDIETEVYQNSVKMILVFIKNVFNYKGDEIREIIELISDLCKEGKNLECSFYIKAETRQIFDLNKDLSQQIVSPEDCDIFYRTVCSKTSNRYFFLYDDFHTITVLKYLQEFGEYFLDIQYQKTMESVALIIENLSIDHVNRLHKNIKSCLSVFVSNRSPSILMTALENWCNKLSIEEITKNLDKESFTDEHADTVHALKVILDSFRTTDLSVLTEVANSSRNWTRILLKLFAKGYVTKYLKSKMSFLTDLLSVSVKFMSASEFKKILTEGCIVEGVPTELIGVNFVRYFIHVFYELLVRKPHILLEKGLERCCVLLNDIVKFSLKKKFPEETYSSVLELVDKLWPTFSTHTSFNQKHALLQDLMNYPVKLTADSKPMLWAVEVINSEASREERSRVIGVLPGGERFSQCYRTFASSLPTRLSDLRDDSCASFRALLDALATTKDKELMDIVATLASGDDTKGWWDDAIDSCMASLASHADLAVYKAVYTRCFEGLSLGICRRIMLPLLRHSTSSFCEKFFASILKEVLKLEGIKMPSLHYSYHKYIIDCTRIFTILKVAFEKIPPTSLESPNSQLYLEEKPQQLWYIVKATCKKCVTLREKITLPEGASDQLIEDYRLFHCANYNCIAAAICRRRPEASFYKHIFKLSVWEKIVDKNQPYQIRIPQKWNQRTKRQPVSIEVSTSSSLLSTSRTVRTKLFLRTLSENPLLYDLIEPVEEEVTIQDIELPDNLLNSHECAVTLTTLLSHCNSLDPAVWRDELIVALVGGERNTKWVLAQAINNCKEELKPHADALRPALLELIVSTPVETIEKKVLNGIHIGILETIIHWSDTNPQPSSILNTTTELLLNTAIKHRLHTSLFYTILDVLSKFLEIYGSVIDVKWNVFEGYQSDPASVKTSEILKRLVKAKIHIPELLPKLVEKLDEKKQGYLAKPAELFGLALTTCVNKQPYIKRFREIIHQVRKTNAAEYVKILFNAQNGCPMCCDEYNFRMTINLTTKLLADEQKKCLQILSSFVEHSDTSEYVTELYETIDFCEFILAESTEAMHLVKVGLSRMHDNTKRRLVIQIAGHCTHSLVAVRRAACEVMLAAFDDHFKNKNDMPPPKRLKSASTHIINAIQSKEIYLQTILNGISCGIIDPDEGIRGMVRDMMGDRLSKELGSRFTESFLLSVYLPCTSKNTQDLSVCVSALLEMLLSDLRKQDAFLNYKLRDDPLDMRNYAAGPSKLLTMSSTYQGTFRRHTNLLSKRKTKAQDIITDTPDIDVQLPINTILETFLQVSKESPQTSSSFCLEFIKSLQNGALFHLGSIIATSLKDILDSGTNELTSFVVELSLVFIEDVCKVNGFIQAVEKLTDQTKNTEGEQISKLLYQDVKLRSDKYQFTLGVKSDEGNMDQDMLEDLEFCIEDLTSAFGKLSNWDTLTLSERRKVLNSGLPPLWTSKNIFREQIESYRPSNGWFSKMLTALRQENKEDAIKWVREMDRWPRRHFAVSAITDAIEWQSRHEELVRFINIQPSDCLAEWAARLMTRTAYLDVLNAENDTPQSEIMLTRSHELIWCQRANERGLYSSVLDCVKRNTKLDLFQNEVLPWLHEHLFAQRKTGLIQQNRDVLTKALILAETTNKPEYIRVTDSSTVLKMNKLVLDLNSDLEKLTESKLQEVINKTKEYLKDNGERDKRTLFSFYEAALTHYDNLWEDCTDESAKINIFENMLGILGHTLNLGISNDGFTALVLNKLDDLKHVEGVSLKDPAKFLDTIKQLTRKLDDFSFDQLKNHSHLLNTLLGSNTDVSFQHITRDRDDDSVSQYKKYLQLICDAEYSLLHYCDGLRDALKKEDLSEWNVIHTRIKEKIFENPFAGSDYQLLTKYKNRLYAVGENVSSMQQLTPSTKSEANETLKEVILQLRQRDVQNVLRLSQLCPALARNEGCPGKLLGLPDHVSVVKFEDQVPVFTDSIRRPTVITAILSNGTKKRYLHKSGEPMRTDAAAIHVFKYAGTLWTQRKNDLNGTAVGYNVTPLSDDSGLIEFIEDHVRLRDLVSSVCKIDEVLDTVPRPADHDLILSSFQTSLNHHEQLSSKVPSYCLRNAIAKRSVCEQDRISKMKTFFDTVCCSSVITWILGVGDRHLQNILYLLEDGSVCHVDWAAVFQYGAGELSPARLTHNVLACTGPELEARLQQLMASLRESHKLLSAIVRMSFKWMGEPFQEKVTYIDDILQGKSVSYTITRDVIEKSAIEQLRKQKFLQLLDYVFEDFKVKELYSVEEQVTCLLRQCTDPLILSVTRSGWEPWI